MYIITIINVNLEEPASIHTGWTPRVACKVSKKPAKKYDESNPMPKSRKRVEVCCLQVVQCCLFLI